MLERAVPFPAALGRVSHAHLLPSHHTHNTWPPKCLCPPPTPGHETEVPSTGMVQQSPTCWHLGAPAPSRPPGSPLTLSWPWGSVESGFRTEASGTRQLVLLSALESWANMEEVLLEAFVGIPWEERLRDYRGRESGCPGVRPQPIARPAGQLAWMLQPHYLAAAAWASPAENPQQ